MFLFPLLNSLTVWSFPSHLLLPFPAAAWLACKLYSFPLYRKLFRIHPTVTLEAWLRDCSFLFAVASKPIRSPLAVPFHAVSLSWKLFCCGWRGRGLLWGGCPIQNSQWAIQITLHCKHHFSSMECLGQSQWHWYSLLLPTPIIHFDTLSPEHRQLERTVRKILMQQVKRIQSPSAGTRQRTTPLAAEVYEKVGKYLCKHLSYNKPRECNWKKKRQQEGARSPERRDYSHQKRIRRELSLEKGCRKKEHPRV